MAKVDWIMKLPKAFFGAILGIIFGGIAGILFGDIGFATGVPWEEIFFFLGAFFGAIIGWNLE
jgi:hypothetical protein